jgi:hypothetical protein
LLYWGVANVAELGLGRRDQLVIQRRRVRVQVVAVVGVIGHDVAPAAESIQQPRRDLRVVLVHRRQRPESHGPAVVQRVQAVATGHLVGGQATAFGVAIFAVSADQKRLGVDHRPGGHQVS